MPSSTRSRARARRSPRATGACDLFEGRFLEVLIIFVLALVVLGPEKLPRVVAEVGRWVGRARAMARQFREQLEEEVEIERARRAQSAPVPPPTHNEAPIPPPTHNEAPIPPPTHNEAPIPPPTHNPTPAAPEAPRPHADERGT